MLILNLFWSLFFAHYFHPSLFILTENSWEELYIFTMYTPFSLASWTHSLTYNFIRSDQLESCHCHCWPHIDVVPDLIPLWLGSLIPQHVHHPCTSLACCSLDLLSTSSFSILSCLDSALFWYLCLASCSSLMSCTHLSYCEYTGQSVPGITL